jgi:hypothetical protein
MSSDIFVKIFRRISDVIVSKKYLDFDLKGQEASDIIRKKLDSETPTMISRFGSVEFNAVLTYLINNESDFKRKIKILKQGGYLSYNNISKKMSNNAGFFPAEKEKINEFALKFINDSKEIDILGSWLPGEQIILDYLENPKVIRLKDIEPYHHSKPWSKVLKGKKVLVIHPFVKTIQKQYSENRKYIFENKNILPEFELNTIKAIQTIGNNHLNFDFKDWFEALDYMCNKIDKVDFDIAIIGAGAYGLSLASYIKKLGKNAIHMGGATQVLFGIKGQRWDERPFYKSMYNNYWTRPLKEETPGGYKKIEDGCYW